jgi:hypothetical protein
MKDEAMNYDESAREACWTVLQDTAHSTPRKPDAAARS